MKKPFKKFKSVFALTAAVCFPFLFSACAGGSPVAPPGDIAVAIFAEDTAAERDGAVKAVAFTNDRGLPASDFRTEYEGKSPTVYAKTETPPTQAGTYSVTVTCVKAGYVGTKTVTLTVTEPVGDGLDAVTKNEMIDLMRGSVYRDPVKTGEFAGLSAPHLTGVDRDEFEKTKYPVPADGGFAQIYDVSEYGVLPSNGDNAYPFKDFLAQIKGVSGLKKVFFPAGVYRFSQTTALAGFSDVYFCGGGYTEWLMTDWTGAFKITASDNIHFNDINFDYETSTSVTGRVTAADPAARTVDLLIDDEFDMSNYRYGSGKIYRGNYIEYAYDEQFGEYYPDPYGNLLYNSDGDSRYALSDGSYNAATKTLRLTFADGYGWKPPAIGTVAAATYTMYEHHTFEVMGCEDFYMENCDFYMSLGMMLRINSTKNIYLNRANMKLKSGSARMQTTTADGLHTMDCFGDLIVTNSVYEASHDDGMNICTFYFTVTKYYGNTFSCSVTQNEFKQPIEAGDEIEIFNKSTMESVAVRTVTAVTDWGKTYDVTLDKRLPSGIDFTGYKVADITRTPRLRVDNCVIRNKRNRGILVQTRDSVITNCVFYNIIHGPLLIFTAQDVFSEGVVPQNITVKDCKFFNNWGNDVSVVAYTGGAAPGIIKGVTVENNFFGSSCGTGVTVSRAGECLVKNNLFYEPGRRVARRYCGVAFQDSDAMEASGNLFVVSGGVYDTDYIDVQTVRVTGMTQVGNVIDVLA